MVKWHLETATARILPALFLCSLMQQHSLAVQPNDQWNTHASQDQIDTSQRSKHTVSSVQQQHEPIQKFMPHMALTASSASILERLGHFLSSLLPDPGTYENHHIDDGSGEGLFGEGDSFGWGSSTLEVVKTQASYFTRPAAFGPRILSDDGLRGTLIPIYDFYTESEHNNKTSPRKDNHACPYRGGPGWRDEDFDEDNHHSGGSIGQRMSAQSTKPPKDWIALVERGGECAFVAKVRVAQALGATAVVVGDAPSQGFEHGSPDGEVDPGFSGRLVTMFAPGDSRDIHIPSTFITRPSYIDLMRLIDEESEDALRSCREKHGDAHDACQESHLSTHRRGVEIILWRDDFSWEWPLLDLAFVLLLLPSFMTIITIIVHRIRLARQRRRERAPQMAVLGLPCLIWRGNGQPWEKVEEGDEADHSHAAGASGDGSSTVFLGRPDDVELGQTPPTGASQQPPNEAGPSSGHAKVNVKLVPVPPPTPTVQHSFLPPGRTYYSCDECAICLSEFVDGDKVRVLPCGHVFHLPEIDSWLLRVKKLCPICKRDITVPIPPTPPAPSLGSGTTSSCAVPGSTEAPENPTTDAANDQHAPDSQADESTPLLR